MTTRLFRGGDFDRSRARSDDFDPVVEGNRYRLAAAVSLAIWEHVCCEATDGNVQRDEHLARQRFHQVAIRVAARRGQLQPVPGRVTRVEAEDWGTDPDGDVFADAQPGRTTHVMAEARRWERRIRGAEVTPGDAALPNQREVNALLLSMSTDAGDRAGSPNRAGAPGWDGPQKVTPLGALAVDVPSRDPAEDTAALQASSRPGETTPLDASVGARMSRLFGVDLTRVAVVPASPAATGATKAVTKDGEVHFRAGAYQPGTPDGDWLIAHELAHVVQQRGGRGERAGTTKQLEREADRAATLAARGHAAPIALRAQRSAAYAFNEGEAHDTDGDEVADHQSDEHADAGGDDGAKVDAKPDDRAKADHGAAADHDEPADLARPPTRVTRIRRRTPTPTPATMRPMRESTRCLPSFPPRTRQRAAAVAQPRSRRRRRRASGPPSPSSASVSCAACGPTGSACCSDRCTPRPARRPPRGARRSRPTRRSR
jgi:hypothetical protein